MSLTAFIIILAGLLLAAMAAELKAYELPVHSRITNEAYSRSILTDAEFIRQLSIENGKHPFGETYYGVDYAYFVYLIRSEDGVWRIDGM